MPKPSVPFKIGEFFESIFNPGFAIRIKTATRRSPKEYELSVVWYKKSKKWDNMNMDQEMVVNLDEFPRLWRKLSI